MGVDLKALKAKRGKVKARMSGGRWQPKEGKNRIRVVTWKLPSGEELVDIEETVHFLGKGPPILCDGEGCLACIEAAQLAGSDDKREKEQGKRMRATTQFNMQIAADRDDPNIPTKLQRWPAPSTAYVRATAIITDDDEYGKVLDPKIGRDIIIEFDPNAQPSDKYAARAAASPSEIDLAGVKPAPFPPSVQAALADEGGEVKGNRRSQIEQAELVEEPAAADKTVGTPVPEDADEEPTCVGEFEPGDDFCKNCKWAGKCKRKKAHKG